MLLFLLTSLAFAAPEKPKPEPIAAPAEIKLHPLYRCHGKLSDGFEYRYTVIVAPVPNGAFGFSWCEARGCNSAGVGRMYGSKLFIGAKQLGGPAILCSYDIEDGGRFITGTWTDGVMGGKETWTAIEEK